MMKDKKLVLITVSNQRKILRSALVKLYRLLKSAQKEGKDFRSDYNLKPFIEKLIDESFNKVNDKSPDVDIRKLPTIAHLCGSNLEKD